MKCPKCGFEQPETDTCIKCGFITDRKRAQQKQNEEQTRQARLRNEKKLTGISLTSSVQKQRRMLCSTGDIPFSYEILDIVFAYGNSRQSVFKGISPTEAYQQVTEQLRQTAKRMNADAVIYIHYDYRVALDRGFLGPNQVFEVFAYGTAVKIV